MSGAIVIDIYRLSESRPIYYMSTSDGPDLAGHPKAQCLGDLK